MGQGHWQGKCFIPVRSISFLKRNIGSCYYTKKLLMTWRFVLTMIKGHFGKVKVIGRRSAKFVSGSYLSYGETMEILTSHTDCLWPKGASWPWPKVILRYNSILGVESSTLLIPIWGIQFWIYDGWQSKRKRSTKLNAYNQQNKFRLHFWSTFRYIQIKFLGFTCACMWLHKQSFYLLVFAATFFLSMITLLIS